MLRAVIGRARSEALLLATAWTLLLAAIALVAATLALADAVSVGGLRHALDEAPVVDRIISVELSAAPKDVASMTALVAPELAPTLGRPGGTVVGIARAGGLVLSGGAGGGSASGSAGSSTAGNISTGTQLASFDDLPGHATLTAGRWPRAGSRPADAVISEGAAGAMRLAIGDRIVVADSLDPSRTVGVAIVGTYLPATSDPYWAGSALEIAGVARSGNIVTLGPIVIARSDLIAVAPRDVELDWRLLPAVGAIGADDLAPLQVDVASLGDRLGAVLPITTHPDIATGLPAILGDLASSLLVTRTSVVLLALQFAILAGYAIVLVAAVVAERRRDQVTTLRARGASAGHVVAMAVAEAVLLVVPAALLAPFVAVAAVDLIGRAGLLVGAAADAGVDPRMLLATAVSAVACAAALVAPTVASVVAPDGLRVTRAATSTLPQRLGLDVALVAVALLALWQLGTYGAPLTRDVRGSLGIDPLLVAAPAAGLLAGAVLAIRIVPRAAELVERALARRVEAAPALGGRQLARRPLRYSRTALLLILAVAFGTYALADAATWIASQDAQAAYRAVGDVRVDASTYDPLPPATAGAFYRGISGVTRAVPVIRGSVSTAQLHTGQLLAVEPAAAAAIGGEGWSGPAAAALAARPSGGGPGTSLALPAGARRIAVTVDAAITMQQQTSVGLQPVDPTTKAVSIEVILRDGDGLFQRVSVGDVAIGGGHQRIEVPLGSPGGSGGTLAGPLGIEAIELAVAPPTFPLEVSGTLDLDTIEASTTIAGETWSMVDEATLPSGWSWRIVGPGAATSYQPPTGQPRRIHFPLAQPFSGRLGDMSDGSTVTLQLLASSGVDEPLPALASTAFLAATGTRPGDELTVSADAVPLLIKVAGTVERLAPLDPKAAFIVVDARGLELRRLVDAADVLVATEWWLSVAPGAEPAVVSAIRAPAAPGRTLIGRAETAAALRDDPVTVGIMGGLALGALAAAVFAVIGFLVGAATPIERVREFAVLESLGLSSRQRQAALVLEDAFLLAVGLGGGLVLGLILAWAVLPFSILGPDGAEPVPPAAVVIPWIALVPLLLAGALLLLAAVSIAVRETRRRPVAALLREWEG